ncbi:MAG: VWA domain-containing protein [Deltaproteobacteria bacterium]|nr:VWA domain-containing protein [Deltaproteobacteria bacterium]
MTQNRPVYPFAALVGQDFLKKALILNAVNPRLGGVLVRGEKGTAKSTAARGLAALLPPMRVVAGCPFGCDPDNGDQLCEECARRRSAGEALPRRERPMPVVDLPLGTTEDRLLGTLDLERALKSGEKRFEPGLLAAANRGILYVDEVNLLDDHLVDVLLDAAAMGVNVVEREGISFTHPARFILVGTMNPEEGELRPQLLDRFGLCVEVAGLLNLEDRMAVATRRLAYEADPEAFGREWEGEQERLRQAILSARARLPAVQASTAMVRLITAICLEQGVDGHRADITMLKAAHTLAALHAREAVAPEDVREAALLVLPHRLKRQPFGERVLNREKLEESFRKFQDEEAEPAHIPAGPPPAAEPSAAGGGTGPVGETVTAPGDPFPLKPLNLLPDRDIRVTPGGRTHAKSEDRRGRYVRPTLVRPAAPDLALDATLRAAAPFQHLRERGNLALAVADPDLRFKVRERRVGRHILFVVDASGSMGADERMAETKAAILSLLLEAYQHRERVGLIVFRGESARLALPFTGSVEQARRHLTHLPTGGKTPLAHGLSLALEVLAREKTRHPQDAFLLVLISDGKTNISLSDRPPVAEAKELAAHIRALGVNSLILDTERYWHEEGCLVGLSQILECPRFSLERLRAGEVVARVGEAWG